MPEEGCQTDLLEVRLFESFQLREMKNRLRRNYRRNEGQLFGGEEDRSMPYVQLARNRQIGGASIRYFSPEFPAPQPK
jgi:hypothetical protein